MQTFFDSIRPYFIYVPFLSAYSGLYKLCVHEGENLESLQDRNVSVIDPHSSALIAISIVPFIGNVIVGVVDIAEKFFPSPKTFPCKLEETNSVEVDRIKKELDQAYRSNLDKLKQEHDSKVDELNKKISDEQEEKKEIAAELSSLKQKVAEDSNPEIIVALATKNKNLTDEIKAKQSELDAYHVQLKKMKEESSCSHDLENELSERKQKIDKLTIELEAKNAVTKLCLAHLERQEAKPIHIEAIRGALSLLSNFRLDHAEPDLYTLASRFNTAMSKIELFKTYVDWRLRPHRNSFLNQLQAFYSAVESAISLYGLLHDKFPQNDFQEKKAILNVLLTEIRGYIEDEKAIALGKKSIQQQIQKLDPAYIILSDSEIIDLWGSKYQDEPYRIAVLKTALCNTVRNYEMDSLQNRNFEDESSFLILLNEIEDKKDLLQKLLVPNRKLCHEEIYYLQMLVYKALAVLAEIKHKTKDQTALCEELITFYKDLETARDDEKVIEKGNDSIELLIKSIAPEYAEYSSKELLGLKPYMGLDEQPFRMKMLLTALG